MLFSDNLLIPALIFAAVGFLVGILVMTLMADREKRKDKGTASPVMDDLIVPEMPVLPEDRFESIVHLYREKHSGKLVTDVNGKVHVTHNTIPQDQLRKLQETSHSWQIWLGSPVPAPAPTPAPVPTPTPAPVLSRQPEPVPALETDAASRPVPIDKNRSRSMVSQIEDVLQEILPDSAYADQSIHLAEEPSQGVVVWIGALKYIGVDSVPDEGVRNLIQAAVRRWEETGGIE